MTDTTLNQISSETAVDSNALRRGATVIGLLAIALIHLLDLPGKWTEVRYLGWGYAFIIVAALVLAEIVSKRNDRRVMFASAALSFVVIVGFVINRTVGMPNATQDIGNWGESLGIASLFIEVVTMWVSLSGAFANRRRSTRTA